MRFDDRLTTVLAGDIPAGSAAVAQYRQLIDILGQISSDDTNLHLAPALARIHALRGSVSDADRLLTVQCLSGRLISPVLVQYLASEQPAIAGAAIRAARLADDQWAALVPALPVRARGFLRNRRDAGTRTRAILDQLGIHDTALTDGGITPAATPEVALQAGESAANAPGPQNDAGAAAQAIADRTDVAPAEQGLTQVDTASDTGQEAALDTAALPTPANDATGPQSIGDIVRRIEALQEVRFKQAMDERPAASPEDWNRLGDVVHAGQAPNAAIMGAAPEPALPDLLHQFQFATGTDGTITTVSGIALGAVYGLSLALPAIPGSRGVDASVATAFSRRMPVRGGRADLGTAIRLAGEWRIDADPCFDRATGRFIGYSGTVRRPMAWERAGLEGDEDSLTGRDGLRQIVHELRTPLNAIMGFSEIIEQQLFGPVTREYRDMASRIGLDARQLLSGFDDLDTALRLDRNAIDDPSGCTSLDDVIERLQSRVRPLLAQAGADLQFAPVPKGVVVAMSPQALDRILPRLIGALIGSCQPGETLQLGFGANDETMHVTFSLPLSLVGLDESELLDVDRVGTEPVSGGPLLGLGFCLRLVRNLLASHAGRLQVQPDALCLTLPIARISAGKALP